MAHANGNGTRGAAALAAPAAILTPPASSHVEAPASATIRARLQGYDVMLTLRGESGADVLPRTLAALAWLDANGATPTAEHGARRGAGGPPPPADPNAPSCPVHGSPMRSGARGWYCPRKDDAGQYCRHTAPASADGAK